MSAPTIEQILNDVLAREGGYCDRAEDHGGPTNFGITLGTLAAWRGRPVNAAEVQALTVDEALQIYRARYVSDPGFLRIPREFGPLQVLLVDCAVLHGPKTAVRLLQRAVGTKDDGILGDFTLHALWQAPSWRAVYLGVCRERLELLGRLISHDATDADRDGITDAAENAGGWIRRAAGFLAAAA